MSRIDPKEISVVVQGPVVGRPSDPPELRYTERCLESIRKHLPGAEIVLSTWPNQPLDGLDYDVLLENDDPGAVPSGYIYNEKMMNNTNRLIVSAREGLKLCSRKYALKFRSDNVFEHAGFLDFYNRWTKRSDEWKCTHERVLTSTVFARDPRSTFPYPYHPSDFFFFGLKEDVLAIWDIPLANLEELVNWFRERPRPQPDFPTEIHQRYAPEQYIWCSFLKKFRDPEFEYQWQTGNGQIERSEHTFANNLVLLTPDQLGIRWLKSKIRWQDWISLYTHADWERMYKTYCDPAYHVHFDWERVRRWIVLHVLQAQLLVKNPHLWNQIRVFFHRWTVRAPRKLWWYVLTGLIHIKLLIERVFIRAPKKLMRVLKKNDSGSLPHPREEPPEG